MYRADWVLPVATPPISRGELLVTGDGRIAAVAPAGALDLPADVEVRELGATVLLPGLVNVHAHPELAVYRGALEDLPFRDWILRLVGSKRQAIRPEDSAAAARWTMVEALSAGMTTLAATEASGAAVEAMREAGIRGIVYQEAFGPDPSTAADSMAELEASLARLRGLAGGLVQVGVSPHAPFTVSDELYRQVVALARAERLPIAAHIAESAAERALVVTGEGDFAPGLRARGIATPPRAGSPIELLGRLGVLDVRPLLIHCVDVSDEDIALIAESGSAVAHCPIANAKLGHGLAPLPAMLEAGVRVGIGTDSVGSNNRLDLLEEARMASLLQRAAGSRYDVLNSADLLRLCTIDGARALGLDDRIGTLEPGKDADLCAVALQGVHTVPSYDPLSTLFHAARGSDVILTVVAGRVLYDRGQHLSLDVERVRREVEDAARRLREVL